MTCTQTTDNQLVELRDYCERRSLTSSEYIDAGISGSKASRPALNRLMTDAKAGRLDLVLVWRADRLGRSLINALLTIADLDGRGIQIVSLREGFDNRTPSGRLQMQIVLALAEYELESIRERIKAGLVRARSQGKRLGRRPRIHPEVRCVRRRDRPDHLRRRSREAARCREGNGQPNAPTPADRRPTIPVAGAPRNAADRAAS